MEGGDRFGNHVLSRFVVPDYERLSIFKRREKMNPKRMTRRDFLKGAALGSAGLALAACVPAAPAPATATPAAPAVPVAEKVRVRWMSRAADWGGQEAMVALPDLVKKYFNAENPDIEVVIEPAPPQWIEKLVAAMIAGDAVDVFEAWPDIFHEWVERDLILDIQPFVDRDLTPDIIKDYIEAQWEALFMNGKRVGMPLYVDMRLESYNKDLFDKYEVEYPPVDGDWDYTDFAEMAAKLTKDTDGDGEIDLWGAILETGGWFYWPRMFGGDYVDPNDNTKCYLDSEGSQAAFWWIWENQWKKVPNVFAQPAQVQNAWYYEAWVPQMVAIAEKGLYPGRTVREVGGKFKWDYAHIPKGPKGRATLVDADGWSIWKGTKQPEAAWKLIKFLSDIQYQEEVIVKIAGVTPVRKSLLPSLFKNLREKFPELNEVRLEVIKEIIDWGYGGNVRWFKNHLKAMEIINPAMDLVFGTGEKDPSYFAEICQKVNESQQ
jgi:multiple sugar transport system substrate-binding protein